MDKKKFYRQDEAKDILLGQVGTPQRDNYESELNLFLIGEAIKRTRIEKNLTQEALGKLIGVQKAQISRIENGKNLTFVTVAKIFKAMGVSVKLEIADYGYQVALS